MSAGQAGLFNFAGWTDAGDPLVGGRLYTYAAGTTTHKAAYMDAAASVPHAYTSDGAGGQFIALNARGELPAPLYLVAGDYDITLKRADGSSIWTRRTSNSGDFPVDDGASGSLFTTIQGFVTKVLSSIGSSIVGFIQAGTGAVARFVQDKLREHMSVLDFGADPTGVADCAAAVQAAIDELESRVGVLNFGGGVIDLPGGAFWSNDDITISNSFITLRGAGVQSTSITFADGKGFIINGATAPGGNLRDVRLLDMSVLGENGTRTTGAAVKVTNAYRCTFQNLAVEYCITGFDISNNTNGMTLRDLTIVPNQAGSLHGIWWHCPIDGSTRSDVLTLHNVVVSAQWSDAICVLWEGFCATMVASHLRVLHAGYGMVIRNPGLSSSYYPQFLNAFDFEAEGFKHRALSIEAGSEFKISDSDMNNLTGGLVAQGNADDYAVAILADATGSITRGVQISNSRVGLCRSSGIYTNAWEVMLANIQVATASAASVGAAPALLIDSNSRDVQVVNFRGEEFGGMGRASYAAQIHASALDIQMENIDGTYVQTGAVNNLSTSGRVAIGKCVEPGGKASGQSVAIGNYERQMRHEVNADWVSKVTNNSTGSSATARRDLATGVGNCFTIDALKNNGGTPIRHESCGSAVTEMRRDATKHTFKNQSGTPMFAIGEALPSFASDAAANPTVPLYGYYWNTTVSAVVQRRV